MMTDRVVTVYFPALVFASQRRQYAAHGPSGLSHEQHTVTEIGPHAVVDCLLWRDDDGTLLGILNYYPHDVPPYERAGNVLVVVDPDRQGEGIGTRLLAEADRRWRLNFDTQDYTRAGLALVTAYEQRHTRP
jgi:GNAT superfamily N-acetyltransferase